MRILSAIGLIIFWGCQPESLFLDVKPAPSQLVVSSHLIPGNLLIVTLTSSFSALSARDLNSLSNDLLSALLVDSAEVQVIIGDSIYTLTAIADGLYTTTLADISPGVHVSLLVNDTIHQRSITASTYVLPEKKLDSAFFVKNKAEDSLAELRYHFYDDTIPNWYIVQAFDFGSLFNPEWIRVVEKNGTTEIIFDSTQQIVFSTEIRPLFTDILSDLSFESNFVSRIKELPSSTSDTLLLFFVETNSGYFDFLQARQRSGGFLASLTNEPINYPGNISGGFGYFALHQPHYSIVISEQ